MQTMYSAMVNSPVTTIDEAFTSGDNHIHVTITSVFPAAPNVVTIGTGEDAVTYKYTAITAGASGSLDGVTVVEGSAKSWDSGTTIYRAFCAYDHDTFKSNIEEMDADRATKTTDWDDIYVDSAATGAEDGTSWTDAFTTIQDAIDSLPEIIAHAKTIMIRKGTSPYAENLYFSRLGSGGSVTLQGEYWFKSDNNSSKTGKLDIKSDAVGYANRAQIAAGDVVWGVKFDSTVWGSTPTDSFRDTVASISGTEITLTTNTGVAFDTSWGFCVAKTVLSHSSTLLDISSSSTCPFALCGLNLDQTGTGWNFAVNAVDWVYVYPNVQACYLKSAGFSVLRITGALSALSAYYSYFLATANDCNGILCDAGARGWYELCVIEGSGTGQYGVNAATMSAPQFYHCHISAAAVGILAANNSYVLFLSGLNDGTTPESPAGTSDGPYIQ